MKTAQLLSDERNHNCKFLVLTIYPDLQVIKFALAVGAYFPVYALTVFNLLVLMLLAVCFILYPGCIRLPGWSKRHMVCRRVR